MNYRTVAVLANADRRYIFCEGCGMCWGDGMVNDLKLVVNLDELADGAQILCEECRDEQEPPE